MTDERAVGELVAAVERSLGPVDVLVLNATGPQPDAPIAAVAWEDHVAQLDFFVKSPVLLVRAVLPRMRERGHGRIVQIDSEIFDSPPPGRSAYAAAKGGQIGLARAWARELAPDGITVNCVAPGFIPVERHEDVPDEERDRVPRNGAGRPHGHARRRRPRGRLLRLRRGGLRHRPAARRRRRPRVVALGTFGIPHPATVAITHAIRGLARCCGRGPDATLLA